MGKKCDEKFGSVKRKKPNERDDGVEAARFKGKYSECGECLNDEVCVKVAVVN